MSPEAEPAYEIEPRNKFFSVIASISEYELRPGNTVTFLTEVDLSEAEAVRAAASAQQLLKPSYTALVVKAVALSLRDFPYANRRVWRSLFGTCVQRFHQIDAAVLCEREVPEAPMVAFVDMLRHADQLSLDDITQQLQALATCDTTTNAQWRSFTTVIRRLPGWLAGWVIRLPVLSPRLWARFRGGAFVVSSPAKYGVDIIATSWPWPLGFSFGLVKERPVVCDGQIVARPTFVLTLNFDRRLMAGAQAARFFKAVVDRLEHARQDLEPWLARRVGEPVSNPEEGHHDQSAGLPADAPEAAHPLPR
jgi:pyruvate/2-oxoglutarate dehydrogenase complex dihydrolipoamide acyltransferase (E2) component